MNLNSNAGTLHVKWGINMDTRFLCTQEAPIHHKMKEHIVAATERDTSLIFRTLRNTARVFRNKRRPGGAEFTHVVPLVTGLHGKLGFDIGNPEQGIWSVGQTVGIIKDIPTCEILFQRIVQEAEYTIRNRLESVIILKSRL
ncbi:hypothetical protein BGX26_012092 [Mortierella sp. AD094]|nr:hypothetical protein BGX26_012092 [Mortierella sp. AD094]